MTKHICLCSFCGDEFKDEDKNSFKCLICTKRRPMGTFPGDRYPTESKDDRRNFFDHFVNTAVDMGAQRDQLLTVAEVAVEMYGEMIKLNMHSAIRRRLESSTAYAVRALARIKAGWPNA